MIITNANGRQFFVRTVLKGDRYGLDDCLTHDTDRPMVEFYDYTFANQKTFGPRGQFVSRYYVSTLLRDQRRGVGHGQERSGLCLDGGVPEWQVDAAPLRAVLALVAPLVPEAATMASTED